jgi:AraC family transcriptional regulator
MTADAAAQYHARMQRVLSYIDAHLDDDLSVQVLSGVAGFSGFHFQRQFSALFGLSVHRYVRLKRMLLASHRLAFRDADSVLEIALDCGYAGPEAFARAFRQHAGQSPRAFRAEPRWPQWNAAIAQLHHARGTAMHPTFADDQIRIVMFPETRVLTMEHRGDPALIGDTIRRFIAWRRAAGLPPKVSATFNILHADPGEYRFTLAAATATAVPDAAQGVAAAVIPPGRCAVLRLTGPADDVRAPVAFIYRDWLPRSGEQARDYPIFVQRVKFHPEVADHESVTDIFLPIQ